MREDLVYHYTTSAGLDGILRKKVIWASSIRHLNDSKEYHYLADALAPRVAATMRDRGQGLNKAQKYCYEIFEYRFQERVREILEQRTGEYFVTSFSIWGDDLSQWRAYCRSGTGYSVGFSLNVLNQLTQINSIRPVTYLNDEGVAEYIDSIVEKPVRDYLNELERRWADCERPEVDSGEAWDDFEGIMYHEGSNLLPDIGFVSDWLDRIPFVKHQGFAKEEEVRLVIGLYQACAPTHAHSGQSFFVPHIEVEYLKSGECPIKEIVVGPSPHPDLAVEGVHALLTQHEMSGHSISVKRSTIPYRQW